MELDKKYYKIILLFFVGVSVLASCQTKNEEKQLTYGQGADTAREALELFCKNEFSGEVATAWGNYGKSSPEQEEVEKEIRGEAEPPQIDANPIVIVSTYYISGLQSNDNAGNGKVIFERLAYTHGSGTDVNYNLKPREIVPEYKQRDEVEYTLKKTGGRWYVYNPPVMRVSLAAVIKCYMDQDMAGIPPDFWIEPMSQTPGRRNIIKTFNDMEVLMHLSVDYLERLEKRYGKVG